MKTKVKISIFLLALTVVGSASLEAQRGNRGMDPGRMYFKPDSTRPDKIRQVQDSSHFRGQMRITGPMRGMHPTLIYGHGGFHGSYRQMGPGYGFIPGGPGRWGYQPFTVRPGMYAPPVARAMRPQLSDSLVRRRMGDRMLNNIPDLTDKQKAEIEELRKDQQAAMEKFRVDYSAKMKELRENHRNKVMAILSDEQKKNLGTEPSKPEAPVAPATNGRTRR